MASPLTTDKPFTITQIKAYVPIQLDMEKLNYDVWRELFETHCSSFGVLNHIDGTTAPSTPDKAWKEHNDLVKMWIYGTISQSILETVLKPKCSAQDLWHAIENLFRDNKEARAMQLENELRTTVIGDLSIHEYCKKLKSISNLLANMDSPITERVLVMHTLNGLSDKFDSIINVIKHKSPFPSFLETRSMLHSEEDRLSKQVKTPAAAPLTSSSPTLLYTSSTTPTPRPPTASSNQQQHNNNTSNSGYGGYYRGRGGRGRGGRGYRGRGGRFYNNNSWPYTYNPPPWPPAYYHPPPPSPYHHLPTMQPGLLGPPPPRPTHEAHLAHGSPYAHAQPQQHLLPTQLTHAFNTMTLQDSTDAQWYMDSGATNHIASTAGNLRPSFNLSKLPAITVGNGSLAPVTTIGKGTLPTSSHSFKLNDVLVCPSIIKNLLSVRKFSTDNWCSIEFDPFGFSIKDLHTRAKLLRCDSPGPLYTISPSTYLPKSLALSASSVDGSLWHQRLGHPSSSTLSSILSSLSLHCNKTDLTNLCHACQLGKHTRQPFFSSKTMVFYPFDIIHSDIWTSPVASASGIKYYLLFLDQFSHYTWVYPLHRKSDTLSSFIHFSNYVQTQFNCKIKALQCDNGGEYDNRAFKEYMNSMGMQFRFSCPYTSQQNGRAERMLRTINNLVRTLLIHAFMPLTYWVEALHTAVHLLNLLPSSAINANVPHTRLLNKPAVYHHLRAFGCLCYPNLLPSTPHKLAPRSTPCVFLGYPLDHRGYRCLDLSTKRVILSRHVIFHETIFPFSALSSIPSHDPVLPLTLPDPILRPQVNPTSPSPPSSPSPPFSPSPSPPSSPSPPPAPQGMHTRSKSGIVKPRRLMCLHTDSTISPLPLSHVQAAKDGRWHNAMTEEYNAQIKAGTWVLVPRPKATNIVRSLWLFRHKFKTDGTLSRYKARLVANGKSQQIGIDCDETFSPVVKPATIRTVLHVAIARDWPLHQLDVKNAFLHGDLEETVYMHQPPGFVDPSKPDHVCLLKRSLYGLKQSPRAWYTRFATFAKKIGFKQSLSDPSLFILALGNDIAYLLLYVDDIVLTASHPSLLHRLIDSLSAEFEMTDLGDLHHFLGIAVTRSSHGLFLQQQNYAADILHRANMTNCNPVTTPVDTGSKLATGDEPPVSDPTLYRSLAGALQYLTFTRPDLSFAVQQICLFMHDPRENHFNALKRILRYVKGTITHGLHLSRSSSFGLVAYSDADWAGCPTTRRSTSGYCVFFGDNLVSWSSKRQPTTSRSSAEAEYRGVANAVAEATWLRTLLLEMKIPIPKATIVYCDNVSAIYMSSNPVQHQRTKHIEIDIHFVRERVAIGEVKILHVPSAHQFADIFTKGLASPLFMSFRSSLSIRPPDAKPAGGVLEYYFSTSPKSPLHLNLHFT